MSTNSMTSVNANGCISCTVTTPIRPRPILASASYSFDSGFEVSPLHLRSFQYEDSINIQSTESSASMNKNTMEDFDEELVSIEHHFQPISVPTNRSRSVFEPPSAFSFVNLADERQNNRMAMEESSQHMNENEINNNDVFFPNNYGTQMQANTNDNESILDMFPFDDDDNEEEDGDDDVFFNEDDEANQVMDKQSLESRAWHIARPSCIVSQSESISSGSSRRSSTPIPIPGSDSENVYEITPPPSVPQPQTHMPYYHRMAPSLNLVNAIDDDIGQQRPTTTRRTNTTFGSRFETSCDMITRYVMPSRFSPVPFLSQWQPSNRSGPTWLRIGNLANSIRSIPNDLRSLSPHYEVDETNVELSDAASFSYGLMFNFSQLSVNEISGQEMDIETTDTDDSSFKSDSDGEQVVNGDNQAIGSIDQFDLVQQVQVQSRNHLRQELPDIVGCHRSASFAASGKPRNNHHHRNTLNSFNQIPESGQNGLQERRTMSVSLPIDDQIISHLARQLRLISNDFSNRQMQQSNPLRQLNPVLDLLASTWFGGANRRNGVSRRQTFTNGSNGNSTTSSSSTRVVNNSRFYEASSSPPTTTGNSTFYVSTKSSHKPK